MIGDEVAPSIAGRRMGYYLAYDWLNTIVGGGFL
jgi:hypothetical protein